MKYNGKALRSMKDLEISGEALVTKDPITLLGFVDPNSGKITQENHELHGKVITNKVFVFPRGVGSTVGPYTLVNLMKNGKGPAAIINRESDQGTVAGCSVAKIPMAYGFDIDPTDLIKSGQQVTLKFENGVAQLILN